jgi:hypothetical protein
MKNFIKRFLTGATCLSLAVCLWSQAQGAVVVFDSLTGFPGSLSDYVGPNGPTAGTSPGYFAGANAVGYPFQPTSSGGLSEYVISAALFDAVLGSHATVSFSLYDVNGSNLPGTSLATSGAVTTTAAYTGTLADQLNLVSATLVLPTPLTSGTTYFLVAEWAALNNNVGDFRSGTVAPPGPPNLAYYWAEPPTTPSVWNDAGLGVGNVGGFTVTAVPEPSAWAMVMGGLFLGFAALRRSLSKSA